MTLAEAKDVLAQHEMSLTKRDGEYRVSFRDSGMNHNRKEETAYYTDDLEDAVMTGKRMANELRNLRWKAAGYLK